MSVSRVLDRTGRAVTSERPATIKVRCQGPAANPAARNTSDTTPDGAAGLQDELWPEMQAFAEVEKQPEHRRAARHEVALVPAGEVAASVVLQQRIAIPQRRGEQHHEAAQRRGDVRDVKGAHRLSAVRGDYRITRGHCPANASRAGALPDRTGANLSIR